MKKFYLAGIVPESAESGGGYSVYIPDVPQVAAGGETVTEAIANATSGLYVALRDLVEQGGAIPEPSEMAVVRTKVMTEREMDSLPYPEDTVYQYIPAPNLNMVPVRLNVSLAKSLVQALDEEAERQAMTRSGFISAAVRDYISHTTAQQRAN